MSPLAFDTDKFFFILIPIAMTMNKREDADNFFEGIVSQEFNGSLSTEEMSASRATERALQVATSSRYQLNLSNAPSS